MIECFVNLLVLTEMQYPTKLTRIQRHQVYNQGLYARQDQRPDIYPIQHMDDGVLLIYQQEKMIDPNWKIVLPETLIPDTIRWYHLLLKYCGLTRL